LNAKRDPLREGLALTSYAAGESVLAARLPVVLAASLRSD
jgi:hypothetical protein